MPPISKNKQYTDELIETIAIGKRLRQERERLGISQLNFARIGGVTRESQVHYESGKRSPNNSYWTAVAILGVDIQYIFTGMPSVNIEEVILHLMKEKESTVINSQILYEKLNDIVQIMPHLTEKQDELIDELIRHLDNKKYNSSD